MSSAPLRLASALLLSACTVVGGNLDARNEQDVEVVRELRRPAAARPAAVWQVVVDPALDAEEVAAVTEALDSWSAAVPCPFTYNVTRGEVGEYTPGNPRAAPPPSAMTMTVRLFDALPDESVGWGEWYEGAGSRVAILRTVDAWDVRRVARHEVGHALHISHLPDCVGVMSLCFSQQITTADVAAYTAAWCPDQVK